MNWHSSIWASIASCEHAICSTYGYAMYPMGLTAGDIPVWNSTQEKSMAINPALNYMKLKHGGGTISE